MRKDCPISNIEGKKIAKKASKITALVRGSKDTPAWADEDAADSRLSETASYERGGSSIVFGQSQYNNGGYGLDDIIKATGGALTEMLERAFPKGLHAQLRVAEDYAGGKDDLIQDIIRTKMSFYPKGFSITAHVADKNRHDLYLQEFLEVLMEKHRMREVQTQCMQDWCVTDNAILHWKVGGRQLEYVTTIAASRVDYAREGLYESMKIMLPEETIRIISDLQKDPKANAGKLANFPDKYIEAVKNRSGKVELKNAEGEYWAVRSNTRLFTGLAKPSMYSVFFDILLRKLMIAGDWGIAFALTKCIELIRTGERAPDKEMRNYRVLYPTAPAIKALQKEFQKLGQARRMFVDHTFGVEYPHPNPEIFDKKKYEAVETRLLRWGKVIDTLMTGQGDGFAQGHLGARSFTAEGGTVRTIIGEMLVEFVKHPSLRPVIGIPSTEKMSVSINYDEQVLKDPKQVLDELDALWDRGALDVSTFHKRLGYDTDTIRAGKEADAKEADLWEPLWEPNQGLLNDGGRPAGEGDASTQPEPKSKKRPSKTK